MNMILVWFILFIVFLIAEVITAGALVSIWFCVGSLAAMVVAYFGGNPILQVVIFLIVSIVLLLATRPLIKKYVRPKITKTNADRILQARGVVTEEINNLKGHGAIKVDGKSWTARNSEGEEIIPAGEEVIVIAIEGVKAMVKAMEKK
ncbi:NfeD family protein [Acetobacterium bakii]|uniref:Membrane protein n=1 Tax=Acetobacterium bakii TaxID=52689 RepID=A0A0L6TWN4_9FIRM|nr:NfeD family protein [Acetobacterium bakii]KNZ40668.1 membrane protein [Acetobacterium bakii]